MSLVSVPVMAYPNGYGILANVPSTSTTATMDADGEMVAMVFVVPKTGNIHKIHFHVGIMSTGDTLKGGIYTVSSGDPTSTAYGGMVAGTVSITGTGAYSITLGTDSAATRGDVVAAKLEFNSYVAGNFRISKQLYGSFGVIAGSNYWTEYLTGGWIKATTTMATVGIEYDDGSFAYIPYSLPLQSISSKTTISLAGDEAGFLFTPEVGMRCVGAYMSFSSWSNPITIYLYDSDSNILGTFNNSSSSPNSAGAGIGMFDTAVELTAGQSYRCTIYKTSGSNLLYYADCVSDAATAQICGKAGAFQLTERTAAGGTWSETSNAVPYGGLIIDQLDLGSSSSPYAVGHFS